MADDGMLWIYLIFFIIPLVRILPRLIRRWRGMPVAENRGRSGTGHSEGSQNAEAFERPQSVEMVVLEEINSGVRKFGSIQKNLGMGDRELEDVLRGLEDREMLKVVTKGGIFGTKVEIHPTEKGQRYNP